MCANKEDVSLYAFANELLDREQLTDARDALEHVERAETEQAPRVE